MSTQISPYVAPPASLTNNEKNHWRKTVNSRPADWFGEKDIPLLSQYVRHVSTSDQIAHLIGQLSIADIATEEGFKRYNKLLSMQADESAKIMALARSMRLTHQSLYNAKSANTAAGSVIDAKPWEA